MNSQKAFVAAAVIAALGVACLGAAIYGPPLFLHGLTAGGITVIVFAYVGATRPRWRQALTSSCPSKPIQPTTRAVSPPSGPVFLEQVADEMRPFFRRAEEKMLERQAMMVILNELIPEKIWRARLGDLIRDPEFRAIADVEISSAREIMEELRSLCARRFASAEDAAIQNR